VIALAVLTAALLLSFTVGHYPAGLGDLFNRIAAKFSGHAPNIAPTAVDVLLHARGPRVLAAVGAALSVAGTAFQGL
jgi:iron complex transport system permease protein